MTNPKPTTKEKCICTITGVEGLHAGRFNVESSCPIHGEPEVTDKEDLDKEIESIAEYLGCNAGELKSEVKKLIAREKLAMNDRFDEISEKSKVKDLNALLDRVERDVLTYKNRESQHIKLEEIRKQIS